MRYVFCVTLWTIIYFDICQPQFSYNSRPLLYRRPKTIKPDQTVITSSPSTKTYYNPNPGYDAYWTDGHWIFGTTTTKPTYSTSTRTRPMVCKKPCGIEYRYVGPVCAQMVNNTVPSDEVPPPRFPTPIVTDPNKPFFTTFKTYCQFLNHQCNDTVWNYMSWVFVHFGNCLNDLDIYLPVEKDTEIHNRAFRNLKQYRNHYNQSLELRTKMERLRRQGKIMKLDANWIRKNPAFRIILNPCRLRGVCNLLQV